MNTLFKYNFRYNVVNYKLKTYYLNAYSICLFIYVSGYKVQLIQNKRQNNKTFCIFGRYCRKGSFVYIQNMEIFGTIKNTLKSVTL